ncbi:nicotinate-nucleotide adenylyltransferase [Flavobacteriaceae bacterium KMM 6898]|nr:nicotinate-nucleotide adenylyltransferase [Flavobacteriaceae bacterium KMM 6898]
MKTALSFLIILILTTNLWAQDPKTEELSEVVVTAVNYKYLSSIDSQETPTPVKLLERKVAGYKIKKEDVFEDEYPFYTVSFYIPEGKIVAVYDEDGKILRTIERFKNLNLPNAVIQAIDNKYPGWKIVDDVYLIDYNHQKGVNRTFKIKLQKRKKSLKVKLDEKGNYL